MCSCACKFPGVYIQQIQRRTGTDQNPFFFSEVIIKNCFIGGLEEAPGYCVNCQDHTRTTIDGFFFAVVFFFCLRRPLDIASIAKITHRPLFFFLLSSLIFLSEETPGNITSTAKITHGHHRWFFLIVVLSIFVEQNRGILRQLPRSHTDYYRWVYMCTYVRVQVFSTCACVRVFVDSTVCVYS